MYHRSRFGQNSDEAPQKKGHRAPGDSTVEDSALEKMVQDANAGIAPSLQPSPASDSRTIGPSELSRALIAQRGTPIDTGAFADKVEDGRINSLPTKAVGEMLISYAVRILRLADEVERDRDKIEGAQGKDRVSIINDIEERARMHLLASHEIPRETEYDRQLIDPITVLVCAAEIMSMTNMSTERANATTITHSARILSHASDSFHLADKLVARQNGATVEETTFDICKRATTTLDPLQPPTLDQSDRIKQYTAVLIGKMAKVLQSRNALSEFRNIFIKGHSALSLEPKDF